MAKYLTRDEILDIEDLKREEITVPEWGNKLILVRELTAEERDAYEASLMDARKIGRKTEFHPNLKNVKAKMVVKCIITEDGQRVFTDMDATAVGKKSASALSRICDVIERLSGLDEKSKAELEGNSEAGQGGSLPSA